MELAKLAGGVLMADRVSLSPVKLLEQHEASGESGLAATCSSRDNAQGK